jgi:hypothetical protein
VAGRGPDSSQVPLRPAGHPILREAFAPLLSQRGAAEPKDVIAAAEAVIEKMSWCASRLAKRSKGPGETPY